MSRGAQRNGKGTKRNFAKPKSRLKPWGRAETLQKRAVNHFDWRGPEQLLEPWRCVRAGGAGVFLNRGAGVFLNRNRPSGHKEEWGCVGLSKARPPRREEKGE